MEKKSQANIKHANSKLRCPIAQLEDAPVRRPREMRAGVCVVVKDNAGTRRIPGTRSANQESRHPPDEIMADQSNSYS